MGLFEKTRYLADAQLPLERARTLPLHRWIHALAIPEVGEQTAWQLAHVHGSLVQARQYAEVSARSRS